MNIELIKAILHVLDPAVDAPILSEAILPPSARETRRFFCWRSTVRNIWPR